MQSRCLLQFMGVPFNGILSGFLKGIYKGSIKGLGFRVSEKLGVPYFGVLIIRTLLFGVPYHMWIPYFRKLPYRVFTPEP